MKKLVLVFLVFCVAVAALAADEADVELRARREAEQDGRPYRAWWWGVGGAAAAVAPVVFGAFFADPLPVEARRAISLAGPVVAGGGLALVGWTVGTADVPEERIAAVQGDYEDPDLRALYESEYRRTLTKVLHRKRGVATLVGAGAVAGAMGLFGLVLILAK